MKLAALVLVGVMFVIPDKIQDEVDFTRRPETLTVLEFSKLLG